jgi:hypothetical protein
MIRMRESPSLCWPGLQLTGVTGVTGMVSISTVESWGLRATISSTMFAGPMEGF